MLLREAVKRVGLTKLDERGGVVLLLSSFEPLHLPLFLQAHLIELRGDGAPHVITFGYDQLATALTRAATEHRRDPAVVFLSWEDVHPSLSWRARGGFIVETDDIVREGTKLRERLEAFAVARRGAETFLLLPPAEWAPPSDPDPAPARGPRFRAARRMLDDAAEAVASHGVHVLAAEAGALNFRDLLLSGCPLSPEASERIASRMAALLAPSEQRKKALVVDLDNTLWRGVIGEDGVDAIQFRSSGDGFPFFVFQNFLRKLKNEGVMLAFSSKNNPADVLPLFDALEMPLQLADFACHRCNWSTKSANLREIARDLNIGLDAICYVDDNDAELAEVARQLPEVRCLKTPGSTEEWPALFEALRVLFATWQVRDEDRVRTMSVQAERLREAVALPAAEGGFEHLRDLQLQLVINPDAFDDPRSLELINKTNQFNLTGERIAPADWIALAERGGAFCASARLRDRFGDFGTIAVVAGEQRDGVAQVRQMVLSCRAFGRVVEWALLGHVAQRSGVRELRGSYRDTGRNVPARDFLQLAASLGQDGEWSAPADAIVTSAAARMEEGRLDVAVKTSDLKAESV